MNDFLKDLRDSCSPNHKTEFPEKLKKAPVLITSLKISENAVFKKEMNDIVYKYKLLEKNYNKLTKKNSDLTEESKILKSQLENIKKDYNLQILANERLQVDKQIIEKTIDENKTYTRKLESRVLLGTKSLSIIENNNKLKKENEEIKIELDAKITEIDKIKSSLEMKNQEMKILNKAMEIKADDFKFKGDFKSSILYDIGILKQEIDNYKEKYEITMATNEKLKNELQENSNKLQELTFTKEHLTKLVVDSENKSNNLEIEKHFIQKLFNDLKEERNTLKINEVKINKDFLSLQDKIIKDNLENKENMQQLEEKCRKFEENNSKSLLENNLIKKHLDNSSEKIKSLESIIKNLNNDFIDLQEKYNLLKNDKKNYEDIRENLKRENENLILKLEDVQMQYRQLENRNNELLKKDKNVVSLQENFENELTKHNQALLLNEQILKEQIAMNKQEIDNLKEERKSLNNLMNEAVVKCSILIKEKNDLEKNIKNKSNQIDNLMNLKTVSNKKILSNSNSYHENSKIEESNLDDKFIRIGEATLEETSIMSLIRREKEKNKEIKEDIKKIKNSINNIN